MAAAIDPAAGKVRWSHSLEAPARFNNSQGIKNAAVHRQGNGPPEIRLYMLTLFGDAGRQFGEIVLDGGTGAQRQVKPLPLERWYDDCVFVNRDWAAYIFVPAR